MLDSLYGNLLGAPVAGPAGAPAPKQEEEVQRPASAAAAGGGGDDMFSDLAAQASPDPSEARAGSPAPLRKPSEAAPTAAAPQPAQAPAKPAEAAATKKPQTFAPTKLMMPPVRKKAEPVKRPTMPTLDLQKLKEEKEALMRQRASAAEKKEEVSKAPSSMSAPVSTSGMESSGFDDGPSSIAPSAAAAAALYGNPDEEYDPAKPNDYDEFCRRRMRQKAEEEMEKRRQDALARQQQASKPPEPKEDDFATKMMKKMGWKEGSGLGKDGQGMAAPLVMKKTDRATGVIAEGQKREAAPAPAAAQPAAKQAKPAEEKRPPTRVLLLNNLVGAGEVDEDLEAETAEEAGKYGKLVKCVVKEIKGVSDQEAVRIFLQFEKIEDATKALMDMNGRYFGGRVVRARFFDEQRFANGELEKRDKE